MEIKIEKLHKQAVDAALAKNWEGAIAIHEDILKLDSQYVDALLGLGFAFMQTGDLKKAKTNYTKALKIDPVNIIARNNLEKINILLKKGTSMDDDASEVDLTPDTFMQVEGKTRVVTLSNIGQSDVLAKLKIGQRMTLISKKRRIEVRNARGEYVGCLPDDISKRIAFFLDAKSKYETIIKASTKNSVDVFIREVRKGAKVKNFVSFPDNIQDDLKRIMNRSAEKAENEHIDEDEEAANEEDEDEDEEVEDLEELAKKAEEQPDETLRNINTGDDDDEE